MKKKTGWFLDIFFQGNRSQDKNQDRFRLKFEDSLEGMERLRPEWEALESESGLPTTACFYQSYAWCHHVAAARLRSSKATYQLCIASVRDGDDRLIGLWPLSVQRQGGCKIARNLDAPFGQFAGLLLCDLGDATLCVKAIVGGLKEIGNIDGLRIERVPETSPLWKGLTALQGQVIRSDRAVDLDFGEFSSFDDYHRTVATKTRKNLRNALNRMRRAHDVDHRVEADVGSNNHFIAQAFDDRLTWMELGGKTTPAFRDPDFRHLLENLPDADPALELLGFELKTPSQVISTQWGFRYQKSYYAYMSARNLDFDMFSPGQVHLGMVIKACYELGIEVIELMAPASEYKLKWTKATKQIDDFSLTLTPKGFLYLDVWHRKVRQVLKWVFERLPTRARQITASLTSRNHSQHDMKNCRKFL